jgi:general secretion pathway protein D
VLGAIPLLGNLFKSRSGSRQKKNLLVFIRPNILRDAIATESVSESKYDDIRRDEKGLNHGKIMLLPGEKQPVIPLVPPYSGLPVPPPASANPGGATPNVPPVGAPQTFPTPQAGATPPPAPVTTPPTVSPKP